MVVIVVGMCLLCDGYTPDDEARMIDLHIRVYGYSLTQVEDRSPWCYTIGLEQSFGHPEPITVDLEMDAQVKLIQTVAKLVTEGTIGDERLARLGVRLVPVHPSRFADGLVGTWEWFYGRGAGRGSFVQVLPPDGWLCPCHRHKVTRLDRPAPTRRTR